MMMIHCEFNIYLSVNISKMAEESMQDSLVEELDFEQELDYEHEASEQMVGGHIWGFRCRSA